MFAKLVGASSLVLLATLSPEVTAQPDNTPCDNNGAYDPNTGTATCGGASVNVFSKVCGNGFDANNCVAKWQNSNNENEWYFFMGAGTGIPIASLPAACSGLPAGLAMAQYKPDTSECYPAANVDQTTITYTAGGNNAPSSVTLNFGSNNQNGVIRNGYVKISCSGTDGAWSTRGDSNQGNFYEVDGSGPCAGGSAPPSKPDHNNGGDDKEGGAGGILLIVFFCGLFVYFAGGFVYLSQVKKLEGRERIPNVDFWTSLPGLIKEGGRFCISKVTRSEYTPL